MVPIVDLMTWFPWRILSYIYNKAIPSRRSRGSDGGFAREAGTPHFEK
jgi:hypothetical protein